MYICESDHYAVVVLPLIVALACLPAAICVIVVEQVVQAPPLETVAILVPPLSSAMMVTVEKLLKVERIETKKNLHSFRMKASVKSECVQLETILTGSFDISSIC